MVLTSLAFGIIICLLKLTVISGHPLPASTSTNDVLNSVINKAVNDSMAILSMPQNLSSVLVNRIIQAMKSSGVELVYSKKMCKTLEGNELKNLFYTQTGLRCISLSKLDVPPGIQDRDSYIVVTNSSCLRTQSQDRLCYPFNREGLCGVASSTRFLNTLSDDFFPRFVSDIRCTGCRYEIGRATQHCRGCAYLPHEETFRFLRRLSNECDSSGKEKWILDSKTMTVGTGCSCLQV